MDPCTTCCEPVPCIDIVRTLSVSDQCVPLPVKVMLKMDLCHG